MYPERRYTAAGSLSGSAINAQADKLIDNSAIGHKISTVVFNYLPALKTSFVNYDHKTNKNYLQGLGYKWFKDSGSNDAFAIDNIEFGNNTYFRITGRIYFDLEIAAYTDPWRYIFRMDVVLDTGHRLRSFTDPGVDGSGNPINIIIREPQAWEISSVYYEISTDFFYGTTASTFVDFSLITPVLPSGVESFTIDFDTLAGEKNTGNNQLVTVTDWRFSDLVLIMQNVNDPQNFEAKRYYIVNNASTGNSETSRFDALFGHAVKPWTPVKLQTSADGSTWVDTTATWKQGSDATNYEFGNLIAAEILSGQDKPLRLLDGRIAGKSIYGHSRIVTTDDIGYLLMQGEFETQTGVVTGTWFAAGVNRGHTSGPVVGVPDPTTFPPANPGGDGATGQFQTESNVKGTPGGLAELGLATQATNYISSAVTAGTVTSIPLKYAVKANAYLEGDDIFLVNPQNGRIEGFTVSVTADAGDTSLSVISKDIEYDFPKDAYVLYSVLNKYTGEGGDGMGLPPGTLGQILRHNGDEWAAYSGATDGHVLTWDSVNGWQAEAVGAGTVTSVGLSMPAIFSVSGSPVTSAGTLAASLNAQAANVIFAGPTSGGSAVPTFRALVTADLSNGMVTLSKIESIPAARLIGRNSATSGQPEVINIGTGLQMNGNSLEATGGLSGTGSAGHVAIWSGVNSLTFDSGELKYDSTNNYLSIGNIASPQANLQIAPAGTSGTKEVIRAVGNTSGLVYMLLYNTWNTSNLGSVLLQLVVGGPNAGDPYIQLGVTGAATWAVGVDNSNGDVFRITQTGNPSTGTGGITITNETTSKVGINANPAYELDNITGRTRSLVYFNSNAAPTVTLGTGAGTGALISISGGKNGFAVSVTTGSGPASNAPIFNVTYGVTGASGSVPVFCAGNSNAATDVSKVLISAANGTGMTFTSNGALSAGTVYVWRFNVQYIA